MKYFVLQTTVTVLAMRYSRKGSETGKDLYIGTTMVLVSEIMKFVLCLLMLLIQNFGSVSRTATIFQNEIVKKPFETLKLSIPR